MEVEYYNHKIFDTFKEAKEYQQRMLMEGISKDWVVRNAGLDWDTDYATKRQRFIAFVRFHQIVTEDAV